MTSGHVRVKQNTVEWQNLRSECELTASDVPTLLGLGYDSRVKLFERKVFRTGTLPPNDQLAEILLRGQDLEPHARFVMMGLLRQHIGDGDFWVRPLPGDAPGIDKPLGASPDGVLDDGSICELKCPMDIDTVAAFSDKWWKYVIQMHVQMYCCDTSVGHLLVYHPDQGYKYWRIDFSAGLWKFIERAVREWRYWCANPTEFPRRHLRAEKEQFIEWREHYAETNSKRYRY